MSTPITTFEDRLRVAVNCLGRYPEGSVCTVYQQDIADALSLITSLRQADAEQARAIGVLTSQAGEAPL